jgi:hypothetical protein
MSFPVVYRGSDSWRIGCYCSFLVNNRRDKWIRSKVRFNNQRKAFILLIARWSSFPCSLSPPDLTKIWKLDPHSVQWDFGKTAYAYLARLES